MRAILLLLLVGCATVTPRKEPLVNDAKRAADRERLNRPGGTLDLLDLEGARPN